MVPGSNAMLFLKPADWDKTARKRAEAGAQRTARAQQAGLHQMTNRSWMMRIGT